MNTLTPLRYHGGKTKLYKKVSDIILQNKLQGCTYVEPFVGGAGLAMKLLDEALVTNLIMNDFDYHIYALLYCVINLSDELINLINITPVTLKEREKQKEVYTNYKKYDILYVGFSTLYLNRTNRSGVLKAGPIGGQKQTGNYLIDCRFNKVKIISKIKHISKYKNDIKLYNLDVLEFIKELSLISYESNISTAGCSGQKPYLYILSHFHLCLLGFPEIHKYLIFYPTCYTIKTFSPARSTTLFL